jgi:hypothetical protein
MKICQVKLQGKPDPVSQFLLRGECGGIHEYVTSHRFAREIHWVATLLLHHYVIDSRIEAYHHPVLLDADTHFVIDHKAKAAKHFLLLRDLVDFADEFAGSTGQFFVVCHGENFNYITGLVIFLPARYCFQGFQ